jgi:hypothetical protein
MTLMNMPNEIDQMDPLDKHRELLDVAAEAARTPKATTFNYLAAYYGASGAIRVKGFTSIREANSYFQDQGVRREDRLILDLRTPRTFVLVG